jgi:hypothetical protein
MMRRVFLVVGAATFLVSGLAPPARADGKRLPKAKSLVESIRVTEKQAHYVRTKAVKPAAAQSGVLSGERPFNQSHYVREGAPAR